MSGAPIIIIKKKVKGHGGHGAAWKVAYADFVTAMMALFIVLWLLAQTDQESRKTLSEYFRTGVFAGAPSLLDGGSALGDKGFIDTTDNPRVLEPVAMAKNADHVRNELSRIIKQDPTLAKIEHTVRVKATPSGVLIEFIDNNEDLLFDLNSSALKPGLVRTLAALSPVLVNTAYRVRIQGHTDARPFPSESIRNNWVLSFERAEQARITLVGAGFPEGDIIGVIAHGSSIPLDTTNPKAANNRRLSLLAVPRELDDAPKTNKGAAPGADLIQAVKPESAPSPAEPAPEHAAQPTPEHAEPGHHAP
jgi:chemotaxis protein MotB